MTTIGTATKTSNKVTMEVKASEIYEPRTDDKPTESVTLYFEFNTGGTKWKDDTFIQTYFSIQDPDITRNYMSVTCNTGYTRDQSEATDITINNFLGSNSFTVASTGAFGLKWNKINTSDASECCFSTTTETSNPYKSKYKNKISD